MRGHLIAGHELRSLFRSRRGQGGAGMRRRIIGPAFAALTLLLAVGFALAPSGSFAQYSTPSMGQGTHQHPAHIHSGTCDTLGDVVYPLNDLTAPGMTGTPIAGMDSTPMAGMEST